MYLEDMLNKIENNLTEDLSLETLFKGVETSYYYEINDNQIKNILFLLENNL